MKYNINLSMNKFIILFFFIFFTSQYAIADVINGYSRVIEYKNEDNGQTGSILPGGRFKGAHDGIAVGGKVYKNSDGVDLLVDEHGNVHVFQKNPITNAVEAVRTSTGELSKSPDPTWNPLFHKATEQLEGIEKEKQQEKEKQLIKEKPLEPKEPIDHRPNLGNRVRRGRIEPISSNKAN